MALTEKEKEIGRNLKAAGKSKLEIRRAIANRRAGGAMLDHTSSSPSREKFRQEFGESQGFFDRARGVLAEESQARQSAAQQAPARGILETGASIARTPFRLAEEAAPQPVRQGIENVSQKVSNIIQGVARGVVNTHDLDKWVMENPEAAQRLEDIAASTGAASEIVGAALGAEGGLQTLRRAPSTLRRAGQTIDATTEQIGTGIREFNGRIADLAPSSDLLTGMQQKTRELIDRIPRAKQRLQERTTNAAERARRIEQSSPAVAESLQVGLDERVINTVTSADRATLRGYKEIVDLAEGAQEKLGMKVRPEKVAGEAAAEQYKLIDQQRRQVGSQIGDALKNLSRTEAVDMSPDISRLRQTLANENVRIVETRSGGTRLDFTNSRFTKAQRNKIKELYDLATEGDSQLTPLEIWRRDNLFSQLQREARFEGLGNIFIETVDGEQNIFRVFRDVFSNKLDEVAPDDIRSLNREYAQLRSFQNDIESSIVKSGKFETAKNVDPSEYAQTNLRRILSDAQSAADYRAIVQQMDELARALGYEGASADDLITFATAMRDLYPEAVPSTSATGIFRGDRSPSGIVGGIVDTVAEAGAPQLADQQTALRSLLEELLENSSN